MITTARIIDYDGENLVLKPHEPIEHTLIQKMLNALK